MAILEVIKYEEDIENFIWKHPAEDFNTLSQLIVNESQEAILFKNGEALDLFGPGRHTLLTENIPLIRKLVNLPTGGISPFHCQVYFINKTMPLDIKWGTNSQIQVLDPQFKILLHAGANGGMGVQIADSRKFLVKLVGTKASFDRNALTEYFRELIVTRVKTYLTNIMSKVSFVLINAHLDEISLALQEKLEMDMQEFGVKLVNFFVSTIQLNERDYEQVQQALSRASGREIEGYDWMKEQVAGIAKTYAGNEGSKNNPAGMLAEAPLAIAFGNMLKGNMEPFLEEALDNSPTNEETDQPKADPEDESTSPTLSDFEMRIKKLEMLKGKIPDESYKKKLNSILEEI